MIKLLLMSKNQKTAEGKSFKKFFTSMDIVVEGEEEKGVQEKSLTVRFGKDVDVRKLSRGILSVKEEDIDIPYKWRIVKKTDRKTGKEIDSYPYVFIRNYAEFEERKTKSTGTFNLKDEADTKEVEVESK